MGRTGVFDLGFGSLFPLDVGALSGGDPPGLGLTLDEDGTIRDGCVLGTADAIGTKNPFVARLSGQLNCDTGAFTGELRGYYKLLQTNVHYYFTGPASADYDASKAKPTFDGTWQVVEVQAAGEAMPPGGSGTWQASYAGDTAPALPEACANALGDAGL
jgi:hypothetical protein